MFLKNLNYIQYKKNKDILKCFKNLNYIQYKKTIY